MHCTILYQLVLILCSYFQILNESHKRVSTAEAISRYKCDIQAAVLVARFNRTWATDFTQNSLFRWATKAQRPTIHPQISCNSYNVINVWRAALHCVTVCVVDLCITSMFNSITIHKAAQPFACSWFYSQKNRKPDEIKDKFYSLWDDTPNSFRVIVFSSASIEISIVRFLW